MHILGIDPGTRILGWGVIKRSGNRHQHVDNGSLYLPKAEMPEILTRVFDEVTKLIGIFTPDCLALENTFFSQSVRAVQRLGEVRGVVMLTASRAGIPVVEYAPREVKKAVTGYGAADKAQMTSMVRTLLSLRDPAEENASDALALALCHAQSTGSIGQKMAQQVGKRRDTVAQQILRQARFYR